MSNSQKHAKNVFETINRKKNGKITLGEFVKVSIPWIQKPELDIVFKWMSEPNVYSESYYLKTSKKNND
jgi:hypothetical protein